MTSQGRAYSRFKRALDSGSALIAWAAALELEAITLADALSLLLLVRDADAARYERAALRWHARLCQEGKLSFGEAELGLAALSAMAGPGAEPAGCALLALCEHHELRDTATVLEGWLAR